MLFYVNSQCCTWPVAFVTDSEETVKAIVLKLVKCCYSNHLFVFRSHLILWFLNIKAKDFF